MNSDLAREVLDELDTVSGADYTDAFAYVATAFVDAAARGRTEAESFGMIIGRLVLGIGDAAAACRPAEAAALMQVLLVLVRHRAVDRVVRDEVAELEDELAAARL